MLPAVAVLLLAGYSSANPTCSMNDMMPCLMPLMMYGQSPEAQQMQILQQTGRELDFTEAQLKSSCKAIQSFTTCASDILLRCAGDIPDAATLIRGTNKLLGVCDRPDLFPKTKVLIACTKAINASGSAYETCMNKVKNGMKSFQSIHDPSAGVEAIRSGAVLRDFCCSLKVSQDCSKSPIQNHCTAEAATTSQAIYDAVVDAYSCQTKFDAGCPAITSDNEVSA